MVVAEGLEPLLAAAGAPVELGPRIVAALGQDAAALLREDPWLILSVPRVSPEAADGFARSVLSEQAGPEDPRRGRALLGWLLDRAALDGHTAQPADVLCSALGTFGIGDPTAVLQALLEDGDVLAFSTASESDDEDEAPAAKPGGSGLMISRERFAFAEEGIGEAVQRLLATPEPLGALWAGLDTSGDRRLFGDLRDLVEANGLVLLATAPGVGKTAQVAGFAAAAAATGVAVTVVGSTAQSVRTLSTALDTALGTAADVIVLDPEEYLAVVGQKAVIPEVGAADPATEAESQPEVEGEGEGEGEGHGDVKVEVEVFAVAEPVPGLVIVGHAHLLDVETANTLLEAVPEGTRVLLAGDPSEPGPAGPGQPFRDLYETRTDALMAFSNDGRIPRVKAADNEPHPLTDLRFALREGELPPPENDPERRLVIVPVRDGAEAVARAVQLVADSIPRAFGLSGDDVQVVTIRPSGDVGAAAVTRALRERLGTSVSALTAREALGGVWPAAVVILDGPSSGSLTRALVYGLCGLGERHLSIVHGAGSALPQAVANIPDRPRDTRLPVVLRDL